MTMRMLGLTSIVLAAGLAFAAPAAAQDHAAAPAAPAAAVATTENAVAPVADNAAAAPAVALSVPLGVEVGWGRDWGAAH